MNGAPPEACGTITPNHGTSTATGAVPYTVDISSLDDGYTPGENYTSKYCMAQNFDGRKLWRISAQNTFGG